jgi:hypothetical protein
MTGHHHDVQDVRRMMEDYGDIDDDRGIDLPAGKVSHLSSCRASHRGPTPLHYTTQEHHDEQYHAWK